MARQRTSTATESAADLERRARAAARARSGEFRLSGHTRLANAFAAFADGRTDADTLTLSEYLDPPDVAAANAARAEHSLATASAPGFVPAAPNAPGSHYIPDADASADDVLAADADPDA